MALWLLAIIVAVGLAAIFVALRAMGFARQLRLTDDRQVRAEWRASEPGREPERILRAGSGEAALVQVDGRWELLWVMGLDTVSHALTGARLREVRNGLVIEFNDFAAPRTRVALTGEERRQWRALIGGTE